jgi:hypothetical protein
VSRRVKAWRWMACAALTFLGPAAGAGEAMAPSASAAALQGRFAAMKEILENNAFMRPLRMESIEGPKGVGGEIYAIVDHPFAAVGVALSQPSQWCDVLILHLNTKYCRPGADATKPTLRMRIGKKHDQPMEEAYQVDFAFRMIALTASYLQVTLDAGEGPVGTSDYRIVLEAAAAPDGRTLVRLSYSYAFGLAGRLAMQAYLGTAGRDKVGFTVEGAHTDGTPRLVGGTRGVVERNTMRYFLAIDAYLGALATPRPGRMEKSLRDWFAASERHARQLREMEQGEYMTMKRREYSRQQVGPMYTGGSQ